MMRSLSPILLCLLVTSASAATAVRASIEQLSTTADAVVRVRCVESEAAFSADRSTIETKVRLSVLETVAGSVAEEITVVCRGGRVGEAVLRVRGQPTFSRDEESILFLRRDRRGAWRVLGWSQGKFRIDRDGETGTVRAIQDLTGLCFARPSDGTRISVKPDVLPLNDLLKRVRTAREEAKARTAAATGEEGTEDPGESPEAEVTPPREVEPGESPPPGK
jgi:hypothetical protein